MRWLTVNFPVLFCLCVFGFAANAANEKLHYQKYNPNESTLIHVLTLDPKQVKIIAVRAQDAGQGLESVDNIAKHFNALAAINGGFFRLGEQLSDNGIPAGVLKIEQQWHGIAYKTRGAIGWSPNSDVVLIDRVQTDSKVTLQDNNWPISAMNKPATGNRAALLSDCYTDSIDLNNTIGLMIVDQKVQAIYTTGNIQIPSDAYLFNISGNLRDKIKNTKTGDSALINIQIQPQLNSGAKKQWNRMPYVIGGGPLLIYNGKKITDFNAEKMSNDFIEGRYARTAIGILPDKRWVLVVAERSLFPDTVGLTIPELQDFMFELGCIAAVNLDGGGSSSMYVAGLTNSTLLAQPVADAVIVLDR
jgi:exopolysaccharide biosynthesis protein